MVLQKAESVFTAKKLAFEGPFRLNACRACHHKKEQ